MKPPTPPNRPNRPPSGDSEELRKWIASLESKNTSMKRYLYWLICLVAGLLFVGVLGLGYLYQIGVRTYAVLEDVEISRDRANQGRIDMSFHVVTPGKVSFNRASGAINTRVVDYFKTAGQKQRKWSWVYEPGEDIQVSMLYRGPIWRRTQKDVFATAKQADIVVLIDTTGSMSRSIETLKEKCVEFSEALTEKRLEHRFALIGFGDMREGEWCDQREFTNRVEDFKEYVTNIKRFDGGDLPESSLEALEAALSLPFDSDAIRRFYLVTDAQYHAPSESGAEPDDIAKRLVDNKVLLKVFTREEFRADYENLAGVSNVQTIEEFGAVLSEGRVLED